MVELFKFLTGYGVGAFVVGYIAGFVINAGFSLVRAITHSGE